MNIVGISVDKFVYFPPCPPSAIPIQSADSPVSFENPTTMRVPALFALFWSGASPSLINKERERDVYISKYPRDRMAVGLQAETGLSLQWWKKGHQ